jgi:large exoprotein involved in heme utilization and adhesion
MLDFASHGANLHSMRTIILSALLVSVLAAPAQAQVYPVQGKWGQSSNTKKGAIDCTDNKRIIEFIGNQRTDSNGGVPSYRNQSVRSDGSSTFRVVDEFSTGQISAGHTTYALRKIDADHIEMNMQDGSSLKLQRCK